MPFIKHSYILFAALLATGCSTVVEKTYTAAPLAADQKDQFFRPSGTSDIDVERLKLSGNDIFQQVLDKFPDYRGVGWSGFRSTAVSDTELKQQALTVGASKVVLIEKWTGSSQTGAIGNAVPLAGGGVLAMAIPLTQDNFEFLAIFLGKYSGGKDRIGIELKPLTPELQQKFERNKGVSIGRVTPLGGAFDANVLSGDILIKVASKDVIDVASVGPQLRSACKNGTPFDIEVLRADGKPRQLTIAHCD